MPISCVHRLIRNPDLNWKEDLGYENTIESSLRPGVSFGVLVDKWMFGVGLEYQRVSVNQIWMDVTKKGPPKEKSMETNYSITSLPFQVSYFEQWGNVIAGVGADFQFGVIRISDFKKDRFKEYYSNQVDKESYYENTPKVLSSIALSAKAGVMLSDDVFLLSSLGYSHALKSMIDNALFKLYPNTLFFNVSLTHFWVNRKQIAVH